MWNKDRVDSLLMWFQEFLNSEAPMELTDILGGLKVSPLAEEGESHFFLQGSEIFVHPEMPNEAPEAFVACVLSVLVGLDIQKKQEAEGDEAEILSFERQLFLMRVAHEDYEFSFISERGQALVKLDELKAKLMKLDTPDEVEEEYRYYEFLRAAKEKVDKEYPEKSTFHRAAFANSLAYLIVNLEMTDGYGGPSVREVLAAIAYTKGIWTFKKLYKELSRKDGVIFGLITQVHHQALLKQGQETMDDDPEDIKALQALNGNSDKSGDGFNPWEMN